MKEILWTAAEISAALGTDDIAGSGRTVATREFAASGVSIDSRKIREGDLFIALSGVNHDGHDYVKQALEKGAVAAIVHRVPEELYKQKELVDERLIVVDDTMQALRKLATYSRHILQDNGGKLIAITGSVGKTSTKDMIQYILSRISDSYATKGNLNNHIGLPLTLANMPRNSSYVIVEMGMNHAGEIEELSNIAKPDIALITAIEAVHMEFLNSIEDIANAKLEIVAAIQEKDGIVILPADNKLYSYMYNQLTADSRRKYNIKSFGHAHSADSRILSHKIDGATSKITAEIEGINIDFSMSTIGKHWPNIAASALEVVALLGEDIKTAAAYLSEFSEPEGRGKTYSITVKGNNITLIDDSYNASPASMKNAIDKINILLATTAEKRNVTARKVAILGDMLELGEESRKLHEELAEYITKSGIDRLYLTGKYMKYLYHVINKNANINDVVWCEETKEIMPIIIEQLQDNDIILVKGSHGSKVYEIVRELLVNSSSECQ